MKFSKVSFEHRANNNSSPMSYLCFAHGHIQNVLRFRIFEVLYNGIWTVPRNIISAFGLCCTLFYRYGWGGGGGSDSSRQTDTDSQLIATERKRKSNLKIYGRYQWCNWVLCDETMIPHKMPGILGLFFNGRNIFSLLIQYSDKNEEVFHSVNSFSFLHLQTLTEDANLFTLVNCSTAFILLLIWVT